MSDADFLTAPLMPVDLPDLDITGMAVRTVNSAGWASKLVPW